MNIIFVKNKAFTLAEVLITLLIIGVVASLIIPSLINDIQDSHYKTAYKKAFAAASQAWYSALNNGELIYTYASSSSTATSNFNAFKNYFHIIKDCPPDSGISNCWANGELFVNMHPLETISGFIDTSGVSWSIAWGSWNYLLVDTNGFKEPNKYGRDRFIFLCKANDGSGSGIPVKLGVYMDFSGINNTWCPSGGCYYQSWLK